MLRTARKLMLASLAALVSAFLAVAWLAETADAATGGRRMALVIGNGNYAQHALKNPVNDAKDVAAALRAVDFEVIDGFDLSHDAMADIVALFLQKSATADVVLFYYAGHGFQLSSTNYIVPSDAQFTNAAALKAKIFDVQKIISALSQNNHTTLVFLDACRDNPFEPPPPDASGQLASRSTAGAPIEGGAGGFAEMTAAPGSFISFSTEPRKVALDGIGRNSPFAQALVRHIGEANQSISDLMIAVRKDVQQETAGQQTPWDQSSLTSQFYFKVAALDQPVVPLVSDQPGSLFGSGVDSGWLTGGERAHETRATETGDAPGTQASTAPANSLDQQGGVLSGRDKSGDRPPQGATQGKTNNSDGNGPSQQRKSTQKKQDRKPAQASAQKKRKPSALPPDVSVGVGIGGL